jgi:hypothetical protein
MESVHKLEHAFLPMVGQFVWCVRRHDGTFLTMEFGSPHLTVREPIAASSGAPQEVKKQLARRRISIVGDWHLWIMYAEWEIHTASYSMRSQDVEFALIEAALNELDGQILLSADPGEIPYSCLLNFEPPRCSAWGGNGLLDLRVERRIVPVFDICEANTGIRASFFVRLGAVSSSRPHIHMTPR